MTTITTSSFELAVYQRGNSDEGKLALVLPGRLDTKDYPHMHSHVDLLSGLGYFALSFDPPGTWGSPGGIGLYTMTNYFRAINELIEHFANRPTILVGHSRGGSLAMLAGTTNPYVTHFAAIMSHASSAIPASEAEYIKSGRNVSYRDIPGDESAKRRFQLPYSYFEDAAKYDMTDNLRTCSKPKLFVAGTRDVVVDPAGVKAMYEQAAEPKVLAQIESSHDYRRSQDKIAEVNQLLEKFLTGTLASLL